MIMDYSLSPLDRRDYLISVSEQTIKLLEQNNRLLTTDKNGNDVSPYKLAEVDYQFWITNLNSLYLIRALLDIL